jgi:putative hemolysin
VEKNTQNVFDRLAKIPLKTLAPLQQALFTPMHLPLAAFRPRVRLRIERERFLIKTAENEEELAGVLKLRHDVFYRELLEKKLLLSMDIDKFDFKCDHIIIIDKKNNAYIGTYRLISSLFARKFYSATEFRLGPILDLPGVKLELGRACVHRDYRSGSTIALLWRGITEYMRETGTKYLFGCSSIKTTDRHEIAALYKGFKGSGHLVPPSLEAVPKGRFRIRNFGRFLRETGPRDIAAAESLIPPLVKFYLHMGARLCGEPAVDKKFKCVDFLTLFDMEAISETAQRKYKL